MKIRGHSIRGTYRGTYGGRDHGKEKGKDRESEVFELEEVIGVKGLKAIGNRFVKGKVKMMNLLDPKPYEEEEVEDEPFDGEKSDQAQGKLEFGDEE